MICESCGKNPAVVHVDAIVNGRLTEYLLCAECAQRLGYGDLLTGLGRNFGSFLGTFFGAAKPEDTVRCGKCGMSFEEIARSGKVGCAECYRTFSGRLAPLIQRIHGSTSHRGKRPDGDLPQVRPETQLSVMRQELRVAVDAENYEQAAVLRDRIRKLERGSGT